MEYNILALIGFGLGGVVLHNLVKMNKINRKQKGQINLSQYWNLERFSIIISVIVVILCAFASDEIKALHNAGKFLAIGFVTIGYTAQSILVSYMGRAEDKINKSDTDIPN